MKENKVLKNVFEFLMVFSIVILSLQKGGFYKSDILISSIMLVGVYIVSTVYNMYYGIKNKTYSLDIISIILLILPILYFLTVLFNNYADLNDSIFEMIRYFNLYFIYTIVKNSNNKKIYIYAILFITLLECILSIDAIANRYLENALEYIGSGYLDIDVTRMSGTLQYANVLAIICLISSIIIVSKNIEEKRNTYNILEYILLFIYFSTLILTGSRAVLLMSLILFALYCIYNKKKIIDILLRYIPLFTLIGVYTTIVYSQMVNSQSSIYITFVCGLVLVIFIQVLLSFVYSLIKKKIVLCGKKNIKWYMLLLVIILIFLVLIITLFIKKNNCLKISSKTSQNFDNVILDGMKYENNSIEFKINSTMQDSRYIVVLKSCNKESIEKEIKKFNYYENTNG